MIQTYETQKSRPFWLLRKCRSDQETLDSKETNKRTALTYRKQNLLLPSISSHNNQKQDSRKPNKENIDNKGTNQPKFHYLHTCHEAKTMNKKEKRYPKERFLQRKRKTIETFCDCNLGKSERQHFNLFFLHCKVFFLGGTA